MCFPVSSNLNPMMLTVVLIKSRVISVVHFRWVPCHHGMARPQVADGGDSLQFWRVAANMVNE
jgi:hypothetical protein